MDLVGHPFDTLKTRMQAGVACSSRELLRPQRHGLFRGNSLNLAALPSGFVYFAVYDSIKLYLGGFFDRFAHSSVCHFFAGSCAEVASIVIRNPFEVVKQQMQVGLDSRVRATFAHILATKGARGTLRSPGFYAGFASFVLREVPFSAIQMPAYELLKRWTLRRRGREQGPTFADSAANGALSGALGSSP